MIYDLSVPGTPFAYIIRLFTGLPRPRCPSADPVGPLRSSELSPDTHWLRLSVEDMNGNVSEMAAPFIIAASAPKGLNPNKIEERILSRLRTFYPAKGKPERIVSADERVYIDILPEMLFSAEAVSMVYSTSQELDLDTAPPESSVPVDRFYYFMPDGVPLASPAILTFKCPRSPRVSIDKMAVYRLNGASPYANRWAFVGAMPDSVSNTVSARIDRLTTYAVFDDSVPPRLTAPARMDYGRADEIHVSISDRGSGVADTGSVAVDGKPFEEWYYDADRGWVRILARNMAKGRHRLTVAMADRIGNVSRKEWAFRVR